MALEIQNPLIQTWCYQDLQVRLFDFKELYFCLSQALNASASEEVLCNNLIKARAILQINETQSTQKIEQTAISYLDNYGRKRRKTEPLHPDKSKIIKSMKKAVTDFFVSNRGFCLLKSKITTLPRDEECYWLFNNDSIEPFFEKIKNDDPTFGTGDWNNLKTPFTYNPIHITITQNKKISLNSSAGLYYWRYQNLSKRKVKIVPVHDQDRSKLKQIFEEMKYVGLKKIEKWICSEINFCLFSYFLIDKYRYRDLAMTGHLRQPSVGTKLFEKLKSLLEEITPCSCCMKQKKIGLRDLLKDNKKKLASMCIDVVKDFYIDFDNFAKELDINKLLEIFNSIPDIYDFSGTISIENRETQKRNEQIAAVAEALVEQTKTYLEKLLVKVDYKENFLLSKPDYFGLTPFEFQKEQFFRIFQSMVEAIKSIYLDSSKGWNFLSADYEIPGGRIFNPSFHTKQSFFISIEEDQKALLKSIRVQRQPNKTFKILFTSILGSRFLDENNWVLSLYIFGTSSGEPSLVEGGHTGVLVEGVRNRKYFAKFTDLTATKEGQGEIRVKEVNSYLEEKSHLKEVRYYRSWPRTPLQIEKMTKEINSEIDAPPNFSCFAHIYASVSSIFSERENCLVWGIKKCRTAGVDLPEFKVWTDGIPTPTPITYFNYLNTRYKDNSFGHDAHSCPDVIHFEKYERVAIPDPQTFPEYKNTYPLV